MKNAEAHLTQNAVVVTDVCVSYRLRDPSISTWAKTRLKRQPTLHQLLALDHVSLSIPIGSTFALVGANGAGKSTLLRVIAGILHPDSGHTHVNGEVNALLGLNLAFRRELSGRENVTLSALARGRKPPEITERLEEIKEFSEIGDAFERPIRTYSTGMVSRIAFAAATAFRSDILIVDEALAAGDRQFRAKAENRMSEFISNSGTVIMVSHSHQSLRHLCNLGAWIHQGRVMQTGSLEAVLASYEEL